MRKSLRMLGLATAMTAVVFGTSLVSAQGSKKGKGTIEIRQDKRKQYRFYYLGSDGKTLAMCVRGYEDEAAAKKDIEAVKKETAKKSGFTFTQDKRKKHRFKVMAGEKTLVIGVRGYETKPDAQKAADAVKALAASATPNLKK